MAANHPTQALPWDCVISESRDQVSLVVAAQIQCHAVTWVSRAGGFSQLGARHMLRQLQEGKPLE